MKRKCLAVHAALIVALSVGPLTVRAGIPVIDASNLSQTVMTAIESVAQTLKQIEQYQTQLQQYENQLQNTVAPAAYIWDRAQSTINGLMNAVDTLNHYKAQLGGIDAYLGKLVNGEAQFVEVPSPLVQALHQKFEWKINQAALDKAVTAAQPIRAKADSARAVFHADSVANLARDLQNDTERTLREVTTVKDVLAGTNPTATSVSTACNNDTNAIVFTSAG